MKCPVCETGCDIPEGGVGRCGMYTCLGKGIVEIHGNSYMAMMPVSMETIPILHYIPGAKVLQVSSVGCNFTCKGCISGIFTLNSRSVSGALKRVPPEKVVSKAIAEGCEGIAFCLNEPLVSYYTVMGVAEEAAKEGLFTGISTNCYFTKSAAHFLANMIDFINVGFKGASDGRYRECGVSSSDPVFRNLKLFHDEGVHVEASVMHLKGMEHEVTGTAERISRISDKIPLQVMRFVPFGDAAIELEPSVRVSESLCNELKGLLDHVYLFNSPGTPMLDSYCPKCGSTIAVRDFYGPMGCKTKWFSPGGRCSCGYVLPLKGSFREGLFHEEGMMGGYRPTRGFEMVLAILECLGVKDGITLDWLWKDLLKENYLAYVHEKLASFETYYEMIRDLSRRTEKIEEGEALVGYLEAKSRKVTEKVESIPVSQRPPVYYSMGTPLFGLIGTRFENSLVECAGGRSLNRKITRKGKPGVTISKEEFECLNPDYIFISGLFSSPAGDYMDFCTRENLNAGAVRNGRVFNMVPGWDFGSPRWILGLMHIANILHPDIFSFDLERERREYYMMFYRDSEYDITNRSFMKYLP